MPKYSDDTLESCESVEEVISTIITDPEKRYHFLVRLSKVLNIRKGVVCFRPYILHHRRRVVQELFNGENQNEIAHRLGVSTKTIANDIKHYYDHHPRRVISSKKPLSR